jgi:hypothetical protein
VWPVGSIQDGIGYRVYALYVPMNSSLIFNLYGTTLSLSQEPDHSNLENSGCFAATKYSTGVKSPRESCFDGAHCRGTISRASMNAHPR